MQWIYSDGGRAEAGYKGSARDCATRAIAIALRLPYKDVYDNLNEWAQSEHIGLRKHRKSSARNGVYRATYSRYLRSYGWKWTPTMAIGSGCKVHLRAEDWPAGRFIARLSHHVCAVIDGIIYDTFDPSREGTRCVYGYWQKRG